MTLRHLRIFITVYHYCSITKAAESLHIAQPSVSLAIQELEHYYGLHLFDRIGRRLGITEAGHSFYGYASHIISLFDEMEQSVKNLDAIGTLRIGATVTVGNDNLPSMVHCFQDTHPNIRIEVQVRNFRQIEDAILENSIDLGLIEGNSSHSQLISIPFKKNTMVFIAAPDHPVLKKKQLSIHDLENCDFILREQGSAGRNLFDSLMLLHKIEVKPLWESISTQVIINAVKQGLGISLLPWPLVREEVRLKHLSVLPLKEPMLERSFYIIHHKNKYLTSAAIDFIHLCQSSLF